MNKLTIKKGIYKYSISINNVKYCMGNNCIEKYNYKKLLKEFFSNTKASEYSINNIGNVELYINDVLVHRKDYLYYHVDYNYSINDELKLTTKSIITKYLETIISNNDNLDIISSINILLESFAMELEDELLTYTFMTYTPKLFLKILIPMYSYKEEQANEYDISYNDLIILQLKMIDYISKNINQKVICIIDIPEITTEIEEMINKMTSCIIIVFCIKYLSITNIKDVFLFDNTIVIDLNDEEKLYELFVEKGICTLKEAQDKMYELIKEEQRKLNKSIINYK